MTRFWKVHPAAKWIAPTLVALVPVILGSFYPRLIFDVIGGIDPYNFVGVGLDYDHPGLGGVGYKLSRVPWVLVEYWFRHALPPLPAQYAIQFFTHILLGLAVYFGLRRLIGTAPALLGASFLLVCTEVYGATSPDYMNAFSSALYAVSFWLVTIAARRPFSYALYGACGAAIALTMHTNPIFLFFVPMLLGHNIVLRRQAGLPHALPPILASAIGGGIAATVVLGLIAVAYGRDFNFMWPQIRFWILSSGETRTIWYQSWASGWWYTQAYFGCYLAVAVASVVAGLLLLRSERRRTPEGGAQVSVLFQYVYIFLVFAIAQTAGQGSFQPNETPFVLLVPMSMALAAIIASMRSSDDYRPNVLELLAMWALILAPLWYPISSWLRLQVREENAPFVVSCVTIAIFCVVALVNRIVRVGSPVVWFTLMALLLGVGNVAVASKESMYLFKPSPCTYDRDGYLAVNDLHRALLSTKEGFSEVYILLDDKEKAPLENCGTINVGDIGWSFRSLGVGVLLTPERQTVRWLQFIAEEGPGREPYILVASNEPETANDLLRKFAALKLTMRAEPVRVREGNLILNFVAIRRP